MAYILEKPEKVIPWTNPSIPIASGWAFLPRNSRPIIIVCWGWSCSEEDPDVIVNAADARLSYLKSLAKDKNADMADRISVQIKEVQLCLLDPAKKAFYDGQLQRRIAALKKTPPAAHATPNGGAIPTEIAGEKWASPPVPPPPEQHAAAAGGKSPQAASAAVYAIPELQMPAYSKSSAREPLKRGICLRRWFWDWSPSAAFGLSVGEIQQGR